MTLENHSKQFRIIQLELFIIIQNHSIPSSTIQRDPIPSNTKHQKIPTCPFHGFQKIFIPYSRFSRIDQTDLDHFPARVFSNLAYNMNCQPNSYFNCLFLMELMWHFKYSRYVTREGRGAGKGWWRAMYKPRGGEEGVGGAVGGPVGTIQ